MNPLASTILQGATLGFIVIGLLAIALPWIEPRSRWRVVPIALTLVFSVRYLAWRITETLPPPAETLNYVAGLTFLAIELLCVTGALLSFVTLSRTRDRTPEVERIRAGCDRVGACLWSTFSSAPIMKSKTSSSAPSSARWDGLSELPRLGSR